MSFSGGDVLIKIAVIGAAEAAAETDGVTVSLERMGVAADTAGKKVGSKTGGGLLGALASLPGLLAGGTVYEAVKQFSSFGATMERLRTQTGATQVEVA